MPIIRDKLKILYSIVIFNMVLVVDYFPSMKITTEMFSHYKAMFVNISPAFCHRIEEIIGVKSNQYVATPIGSPAPPPIMVLTSKMRKSYLGSLFRRRNLKPVSTGVAPQMSGQVFTCGNPSFFTAINATVPNKSAPAISVAVF